MDHQGPSVKYLKELNKRNFLPLFDAKRCRLLALASGCWLLAAGAAGWLLSAGWLPSAGWLAGWLLAAVYVIVLSLSYYK
jgi:hypothetical protein